MVSSKGKTSARRVFPTWSASASTYSAADLDEASTTLVKRARIMLDADFSFISVRDDSEPETRHHVRYVDGPTTAINHGLYFPIGDDVGLVSLYRPGQGPVWTADYPSDTRFSRASDGDAAMRSEGVHSLMVMPMEHEDQHFGNLYVGSRTVRSFSAAERSLFASLCSFAGIALARASEFSSNTEQISALERRLELRSILLDTGAGPGGMDGFVLTAGEQLGVAMRVTGHDGSEIASYKWEPDTQNILTTALTVGDDYHGELSVASLDDQPVSVYPLKIEDLATTAAVVMCGDNRMSLSVSQLRNDLLHDVLDYRQRDSRLVQIYARRLALDLNQPHVVVIVRPERGGWIVRRCGRRHSPHGWAGCGPLRTRWWCCSSRDRTRGASLRQCGTKPPHICGCRSRCLPPDRRNGSSPSRTPIRTRCVVWMR